MTMTLSLPHLFCSAGSIITDIDATFSSAPNNTAISESILEGNTTFKITSVEGKSNKQNHQFNVIQNDLDCFMYYSLLLL